VTDAKLMSAKTAQEVVVRIVYKHPKDAQAAVNKFDGQNADGRKLSIKILGAISADLSHRLGNPPTLNGSVDALIGGADGESYVTVTLSIIRFHCLSLLFSEPIGRCALMQS
jgi:hypothetical protein